MIPSIGRIVQYKLNETDVHTITNNRRTTMQFQSTNGAQLHHGNVVRRGDVFPMIITKIWATAPDEDTAIQGQVFLDGNDVLWVTSVIQGEGERQWSDPRKA